MTATVSAEAPVSLLDELAGQLAGWTWSSSAAATSDPRARLDQRQQRRS
jgi:hypothetical protein